MITHIQGRLVETLISGNVKAGKNEIIWDANLMSSGVYFVKLNTKFGVMTKKIILMK